MPSRLDIQVPSNHYFEPEYDDLTRFISYFHQIDLVRSLRPRNVLEIGVGNKTVANYLRHYGTEVATCDFDPELKPDCVADIRSLPFRDRSFHLVMACEVLEHLPWSEVEPTLRELHRTTERFVLLSIPHASASLELILRSPLPPRLLRTPFLSVFLRIPLFFTRIRFTGEHYWEMGRRSYPVRKIRRTLRKYFEIHRELRPVLHSYLHFFVLEKK